MTPLKSSTHVERKFKHKQKMTNKRDKRVGYHKDRNPARFGAGPFDNGFSASVNRHTGKPHEHKREIARRLRQQGQGS